MKQCFLHGTRINNLTELEHGLKPINIEESVAEIKRLFNVGDEVDNLLEPHIIAKKNCHFVYLTTDFAEAYCYAESGSNFENLLALEICSDITRKGWNVHWKPLGCIIVVELNVPFPFNQGGHHEYKLKYISPSKFRKIMLFS